MLRFSTEEVLELGGSGVCVGFVLLEVTLSVAGTESEPTAHLASDLGLAWATIAVSRLLATQLRKVARVGPCEAALEGMPRKCPRDGILLGHPGLLLKRPFSICDAADTSARGSVVSKMQKFESSWVFWRQKHYRGEKKSRFRP
ncbi:unnamed protein product [Rangifer tarandus platyrhynchus]|uniref:Uncharacterized protein n=1 Tax=Rangifer tarandus platyrhynchus TaxID=3082113 RepID=A0ABN8XPH9_RANTA|nr:unnamed protein product [Rangifer tarandus platyrhynchus]